jgi:hypothetical protein
MSRGLVRIAKIEQQTGTVAQAHCAPRAAGGRTTTFTE